MKSPKNIEFPYHNGVQIKAENANTFDGRIAESVKEELDVTLWLNWIGEQYYKFTEASKRKKLEKYEFIEQTEREQEAEEKKSLLRHLQVKPNPLKYASISKVYLNYAVVALGMFVEFLIFQNIAENVFGMSLFKSYCVGFLVLLFTKFISISTLKYIKQWIQEQNLLFRTIEKTIIFVFAVLILLNATMLGVLNLNQIDQQKKIGQIENLEISIAEAVEYNEDSSQMETDLAKLQAELNGEESGFLKIVKVISIALIGFLSIGGGAYFFVIADFYNDALKLKKKLEAQRDRQAELRANLGYFLTTYDDLVSLQKEITQLFGQKHFLEKCLSPKQSEVLKINPENNNSL